MKNNSLKLLSFLLSLPTLVLANPQGLTVQSGTASAVVNGNQLTVTASHNAFLNWQSFNIAAGQTTTFVQPSASSVVWNRINDANPSQIYGNLTANGVVVLMNQNGFYFGPNSFVSAAGLVVSTAPIGPIDSSAGLFWQFTGPSPSASIINYGQINVGSRGSAFLIAAQIENYGRITAPDGNIGLVAGQEVLLSERPDGRGLSATVKLPTGSVNNSGELIADAGTIALQAQVVNQGGLVQATSVQERNGIIELIAADALTLGAKSVISAGGNATSAESHIKLEAGTDIKLETDADTSASILAGQNWSVTLQAGRDFSLPNAVTAGKGSILFSGTASLQAQNGDINLLAGQNVTVAQGHVRTMSGGDITVKAVAGSIDSGTKANGFRFNANGYTVHPDLGGISTYNGGDVSLTAGLDVLSYLPVPGSVQTDAGSGAFGAAAGNVTVVAGRDVIGHYVVRNGVGSITAGHDAGTTDDQHLLALSLVRGGWTVNAGNDIWLQEVRNPNGLYNNLGSSTSANRHRFDYASDAYTVLNGGNSVRLLGTSLPRYLDTFSKGIPSIYPGTLEITAGAGGVLLGNNVILFPSPVGNLSITTTGGGSLQTLAYANYLRALDNYNQHKNDPLPPELPTKPADLWQLIVSDSSKTQYRATTDFGIADHSGGLLHLNDPEPVRLDIEGDMVGIILGVPKRAEINIGGDMINSRFDGQHLHDSDVTTINVSGNVINRNEFTSVPSAKPNFSLFDPLLNLIYPPLVGAAAGVESLFTYNEATGMLTFQGPMTGDQRSALLNLRIRAFDENGQPKFLPNGEPDTVPAEFVSASVIENLYKNSQDVPANPDTGYRIGGGGTFNFTANNLDLGATVGIVSQGPRANAALANLFTEGTDINLTLSGDLEMFSSKIASFNGGEIFVYADGKVSVGSRDPITSGQSARGIFTVDQSDVTVIARGDINVNGSRIAAYDGGNVLVRSLEGDVDAGTGGGGAAAVEKIYVNPVTRQIQTYTPTIPGSGILATSFPPPPRGVVFPLSVHTAGNILVEAPRGDIIANSGGVVQIPLNGIGANLGTVTLRAGTKDANGNVVYVGNIDASGSGVIGSTVKLEASGDIKGLVFARGNLDIDANQNVSVTALAGGNAAVSAGETISGTIVGVGSVSASGATVDAALLSQNVSASGDVSAAQQGFAQGNSAASTSQSLASDDKAKEATTEKKSDEDELAKKRQPGPRLAKTTGRVTVILPTKS